MKSAKQVRLEELRKSLRQWQQILDSAERNMRFFFRRRWDWSNENAAEHGTGYDYCCWRFYRSKQERKKALARIAHWSAKLLEQYSD